MRSRFVASVVSLVAVLAACGGSDASSSTSSPATVPTTAAATTTATTVAPATTTTAPTTTVAPTSTTEPEDELIADIEADLNAGEAAFLAAGAAPSDPAVVADLATYFGNGALDDVKSFIEQLAADGLRVRPNPEVPSVLKVFEVADVTRTVDPITATIEVCRVDAGVVYQPIGAQEAIVNDVIGTAVARSEVSYVNGTWRLDGGTTIEGRSGQTTCES